MEFMNGSLFGRLSASLALFLVLFIASTHFNQHIDKSGWRIEGDDWKLVVIGVFYTQVVIGLLDILLGWNAFLLGMMAYAASGLPMIIGAQRRNKEAARRAEKALSE